MVDKIGLWKGKDINDLEIQELREAVKYLIEEQWRSGNFANRENERKIIELEKENAKLWKALGA